MSKAGESILRGAREALAYARGEREGFVAHVPEQVDVRAIRKRLGVSQAKFATQFGFALDAVRNWEQGRRQPDVSARAFLMVIDREPDAVRRALFTSARENAGGARKRRPPLKGHLAMHQHPAVGYENPERIMSNQSRWIELLQDAIEILQTVTELLSRKARRRAEARFFNIFVLQSKQGLEAIIFLYKNDLKEPAQVLVRSVLEYRINFDVFLSKFLHGPSEAMRTMLDAMMLEKIKQMESVDFRGLELVPGAPTQDQLRQTEREIRSRHSPSEVGALRKYGFSGMPLEQRARQTGHVDRYNVVYRNFSRNVHGSDYAEYLMRDLNLSVVPREVYIASRDQVSLSTTALCGIGILEPTVRLFRFPVMRKINSIKKRISELNEKSA